MIIGTFHCLEEFPYDVPRQGVLAGENRGYVELLPGKNFEQALVGLDSFSHIWLLFQFHHNRNWNPMVRPPRHRLRKIGVFASRAPYRPTPIGLSCVKLQAVRGLRIYVSGHDLLDGTPILDIKPYLPYADAFPDASPGWTAEGTQDEWEIRFSPQASAQISWLEANGVPCIGAFLQDHLSASPLDSRRHRLYQISHQTAVLAYRTWRTLFQCDGSSHTVTVLDIRSGYSTEERSNPEDKYGDKEIHRQFQERFPTQTESAAVPEQNAPPERDRKIPPPSK